MDQKQCGHRRVATLKRIDEPCERRICQECGAEALDISVVASIKTRKDVDGLSVHVPNALSREVVVLVADGIGGYYPAWSIKAGSTGPTHPELARQLAELHAPPASYPAGQPQSR